MPHAPLVVWAVRDGKAGHENQTRGLLQALVRLHPLDVHWIDPLPLSALFMDLLLHRFTPGRDLPDPVLLIGAGHGTHLPLLAARRARGGRIALLMKPTLPRAWFDLCIVPEHDQVRGDNVLVTRGALNSVSASAEKDPDAGLILVGGPSRHHGWDEAALLAQIQEILSRDGDIRWTLTTSRRTPASTLAHLGVLSAPNLKVVPFADTDRDWLPAQLARATRVWVTEDSASMLYEALTARAATGVLPAPAKGESRIARGVAALARDGMVTGFRDWQQGKALAPPATPFDEAARVAEWISERWLRR
jgi:mitochondrial fission protein ELM1